MDMQDMSCGCSMSWELTSVIITWISKAPAPPFYCFAIGINATLSILSKWYPIWDSPAGENQPTSIEKVRDIAISGNGLPSSELVLRSSRMALGS
jgi:hypothetical protein